MSKIVLARVDSRLIHGQVVTKWLQQSAANEIIVVSDELEQDEFLQSIYLMAAPPGVEVIIKGMQSVKTFWENEKKERNNKVLFLVPDLITLKEMVEAGIITEGIQVGGLGGGPNRKNVIKNINLSEEDVEILEGLLVKKMDVYFQAIPEETPVPIQKLIEKYKTL
ncbi:PTS sugar transporter subunit IIB [Enterococcus dongliensis]|uniref:PTS sugar transporter subunit IIB n=1 Tax=Enterococcus dongliensis TaxID=2559925 RepID=A0AAP5NNC6_9ENTE|nr:PTS sugar transporter subunit IIB [Enterococcus dongliensis]MDT2597515.1 PTS sugar transporter subunit IIB [Enterococcus dongliensis]MDT2604710.1 PTS sugar transporter subunit IIB [Enterococcus dongliensis]MDT2635376.1 PTS sugar transporter subunit IIB [Enterococcus dongliensis]MDT2638238.1 PTS sugar transporter subunit IIB [Enterococcus dongliensis]MDT2640359.1 PTS sugar transporter subunit IIB [Enterococcus dongliensis]